MYLGYHTLEQVGAGLVIGYGVGAAWLWLGDMVVVPRFREWQSTALARTLRVRDCSLLSDVTQAEYDCAVEARKGE